jgi:hypothetical protein
MNYKEHKIEDHVILLPYGTSLIDDMSNYIIKNIDKLEDPILNVYIQNIKVQNEIFKFYQQDTVTVLKLLSRIKIIDDEILTLITSFPIKILRSHEFGHIFGKEKLYKLLLKYKVLYYEKDTNLFFITNEVLTYKCCKTNYIIFKNPESTIDDFVYLNPDLKYFYIIKYKDQDMQITNNDKNFKLELEERNKLLHKKEEPNENNKKSDISVPIKVKKSLWKRIISKLIGI